MLPKVAITLLSTLSAAWILSNSSTDAAKVLMITFQQPSHVIMKLGIATDLIERGHEVYFLLAANNPMVDTVRQLGIHVVGYQPAPGVMYPFTAEFEEAMADVIFSRKLELFMLSENLHEDCRTIMSDEQLINHLKESDFDIMVLDPFIVNPCHLLVPFTLGVPYIMAIGIVSPLTSRLPALPSFTGLMTPGGGLVKFPSLRTLAERLANGIWLALGHNVLLPILWSDTSLIQKYAPGIESWDELMLQSELLLIENDHLLDVALPLLPHAVTIAGCTARPPRTLPDGLDKIMSLAGKSGVVLASFGTTAHRLPFNFIVKLFAAFGRLQQTVMTKMAAIPANITVPNNIHLVEWLPQNDILGHPNTKLFITHCGSNSQYEALYHGVPMLGIPMFAEQGWNCARAEHKGIALCLDLLEFTAEELYNNIMELIENETFRTNARRLSDIRKDEPLNGCEKAGYWINHVIKYGGEHLRSPPLKLSINQFLMIDLILALIVLVSVMITFISIVTIALVRAVKHSLRSR